MQSLCVVQVRPVDCDLQLPLFMQQGCVAEQDCATSEQVGGGVDRSNMPLVPAMSSGVIGGPLGLMHVPVVEPGGTTHT